MIFFASPSLKEPRLGRVEVEADCAVTEAGVDLIDGDGDLLAARPFRRGEGREKIALARFEHLHLATLDMQRHDRARLATAPELQPEGAVQAQEEGGILRGEAGHATRPASTGHEGDGDAEAGGDTREPSIRVRELQRAAELFAEADRGLPR